MAENPATDENRVRWEYRNLLRKTEEYLIDDLNAVGAEGWELVCVEYRKDLTGMGDSMCWTAFLKRPYTGEQRVELKQQHVAADEIEKKQKFAAASLDDSDPEFQFQGELEPRPQPYDAPSIPRPAPEAPALDDLEELKLEGDDGGLKLEGDEGGLKLEGDDTDEWKLQDEPADAEVIDAEEIVDDEEEGSKS